MYTSAAACAAYIYTHAHNDTNAVPILQWISGLANTTSGEVFSHPSSHAAMGGVAPLTTHLQCHPEIAAIAVGMSVYLGCTCVGT